MSTASVGKHCSGATTEECLRHSLAKRLPRESKDFFNNFNGLPG